MEPDELEPRHLDTINQILIGLAYHTARLDRAQSVGIDVIKPRADHAYYTQEFTKLKNTYFPGQR
jgi:hypothetical protein